MEEIQQKAQILIGTWYNFFCWVCRKMFSKSILWVLSSFLYNFAWIWMRLLLTNGLLFNYSHNGKTWGKMKMIKYIPFIILKTLKPDKWKLKLVSRGILNVEVFLPNFLLPPIEKYSSKSQKSFNIFFRFSANSIFNNKSYMKFFSWTKFQTEIEKLFAVLMVIVIV